jgi:cyanate permease
MIVRQEFGAQSFGTIYGAASMGIGLASASGPALWGFLHGISGGFSMPLILSSGINILAAFVILGGPLLGRGRQSRLHDQTNT